MFHRKGLTTGQKIKNLESLITTQLDMQVEATMDEEAIKECLEDKEDTRNEECSEDREEVIRHQERRKGMMSCKKGKVRLLKLVNASWFCLKMGYILQK